MGIAATYIDSLPPDHPQGEEFTFLRWIEYPVRRLIVNQVVIAPVVFLAVAQYVLEIMAFISTFWGSWFSLISGNEVGTAQWWTLFLVLLFGAPFITLTFSAVMFLAYYFNVIT